MAVSFTFEPPIFDESAQRWFSRGNVFAVQDGSGGAPATFVPVEGFNPVRIVTSNPSIESVKAAWVVFVSQVESTRSAQWAAHVTDQKFDGSGTAL